MVWIQEEIATAGDRRSTIFTHAGILIQTFKRVGSPALVVQRPGEFQNRRLCYGESGERTTLTKIGEPSIEGCRPDGFLGHQRIL